ncbi:hypothetical protein MKX01_013019 [Papaver californicum]|nr:hypothetical protein MKX01_013019 [Papaver californicum]
MSNFTTTKLAVALGLCLLLLSFSYSAEATQRSTSTDVAAPAVANVANGPDNCHYQGYCKNPTECRAKCTPLGYQWSRCWPPATSSNSEKEQIDPSGTIPSRYRCCCYND